MHLRRLLLIGVLGLCHASVGRADHAFAQRGPLDAVPTTHDDRGRALLLAGESIDLLDQHHPAAAEAKLREAIAILPDKAVWQFNLACILAIEGQSDPAMDALEHATDLGFTDFTSVENASALVPLHELPRYKALVAKKAEITHKAADRALQSLRTQFGDSYLYGVDEERKLIFATNTDQATLDALKVWLKAQANSQANDLFSHKPDEFIRVVVPSLADYHKLIHRLGVRGIYDDESRTLVAQQLGQVMTHEFTHALHAADQRALGQQHPIWLREGLASMYEAADFENDQLIPHDNFRLGFVHQAALRKGLIPFDKMLRLRQQDFLGGPNLSYGQTSSLLLYLYEQKLLHKFYDAYTQTYGGDPTGQTALESVTGMKLPELQLAWTQWMLARKVPSLTTGPGGPTLGVHFGTAVDGLKISFVLPDSPAAKAGIKPGDLIVGFDNHEIRDYNSFSPLLATHKVGEEVTLKLRRDGKYLDVPVVLGQR